jgi:glycosyltransferase involved in cell wall biosynthesis
MPARLIMVGDGPERISAVGVARHLDLCDKIKFLGTYEAIERLLPLADLVIQPSEHESFGLVPLEAMASRAPVVATASGGICEVVVHGETGYLCEVGDIEEMARCAIEVLSDPAKAQIMGEEGRARALNCFSRERIIGQYEELYRGLLS